MRLRRSLTTQVTKVASCEINEGVHGDESLAIARLTRWLEAARHLSPERRAAALLLGDLYMTCSPNLIFYSEELDQRLRKAGVKFEALGSPQDGLAFNHNLRDEAEKIDPEGVAGELAGLISLGDPCSLKGRRGWPDLVIEKGQRIVARFPEGSWTPYFHFVLARAHAGKLYFAYPDSAEEMGISRLPRSAMQAERDSAVEEFEQFLHGVPDAPESVLAWQEAWRLLAGLPPSEVRFGCDGE